MTPDNIFKSRIRNRNQKAKFKPGGTIVYWQYSEFRFRDNWAVNYGMDLARQYKLDFKIISVIRPNLIDYLGTSRLLEFLLGSINEVNQTAAEFGVEHRLIVGDPVGEVSQYLTKTKASAVLVDFNPLNYCQDWVTDLSSNVDIPVYEIDSRHSIPLWVTSEKQEHAAYTIRPKLKKLLPEYIVEFPELEPVETQLESILDVEMYRDQIKVDKSVKPTNLVPGHKAGMNQLNRFIKSGLEAYSQNKNDPSKEQTSNLSAYLHFGNISVNRVVQLVRKADVPEIDKKTFIEELVIRRELASNFCYYNKKYKTIDSFADWAKKTLADHQDDPREYAYNLDEFENSLTDDPAWNAAQTQMVTTGKMHGYMRMYWAKKILEWTEAPKEAIKIAIYLNDKYQLDGRDANGYAGIAWSIGGVHDRAWSERGVFGKIRYMNFNGLKRKFDVQAYIDRYS